jgi:hypothetical protein
MNSKTKVGERKTTQLMGLVCKTPQPYLHATWPPRLTTSKGRDNLEPLIALEAEDL